LKSTQDLSVQVKGKDGVDNLEGVLFENHVVGEILGFSHVELLAVDSEVSSGGGEFEDLITLLGDFGGREGDEGTDTGGGGDQGEELCVKKLDGISLSRKERVDNFFRDGKGLLGIGVLGAIIYSTDGDFATLEVCGSLLADEDQVTLDSLKLELVDTGLGLLDHEGVVSSAETTVTSDDNKGNLVNLTLSQQRKVGGLSTETVDKASEDALKSLRKGTSGHDGVLGTTDLSRSDKLHGTGDLFRVVDGGDTVTDGVGLSVVDDDGTTSSVGDSRVGEDIVKSRGGGHGGERRRGRGESSSSGKSREGDAKELHGAIVNML